MSLDRDTASGHDQRLDQPETQDPDTELTSDPHEPEAEQEKKEPAVTTQLLPAADPDESQSHPPSETNTHAPKPKVAKTSRLSLWWKEVLACSLIVASVAATAATLSAYQNQPLPDWPHKINIATLLSIYSVVLRAAVSAVLTGSFEQLKWARFRSSRPLYDLVLHDKATRGFMGALPLLWKRLGLAQWIGALLLILTLLVEPFTQEVLQYDTCWLPDSNLTAAVPRTMIQLGHSTYSTNRVSNIGGEAVPLTQDEQAAIGDGLYSVNPIDAFCPTANCTFPSYQSFGYCGRCDDRSDSLEIDITINGTWNILSNTTLSYEGQFVSNNFAFADWPHRNGTNHFDMATAYGMWLVVFGLAVSNASASTSASSSNTTIASYSVMDPSTGVSYTDCNVLPGQETSWRCRGYGAVSCYFDPCVREYSAQIVNGSFIETVINETTVLYDPYAAEGLSYDGGISTEGYNYWTDEEKLIATFVSSACLSQDQLASINQTGGFIPNMKETQWLPIYNLTLNSQQNPSNNNPISPIINSLLTTQPDCVIIYDEQFYASLSLYLTQGDFSGVLVGDEAILPAYVDNPLALSSSSFPMYFSGPALLTTLYNYGNFSLERSTEIVQNMSLSLTNYIRMNPGLNANNSQAYSQSTGYVYGTAYAQHTCLRVRWQWLSLPGVVAAASLILAVTVAVTAGRRLDREVASWRSSPLPLTFAGPGGTMSAMTADTTSESGSSTAAAAAAHTTGRDIKDMNARARKMIVRLQKDDDGEIALLRE